MYLLWMQVSVISMGTGLLESGFLK